mmetsp:Transcript_21865/g.83235  ORF Transcript_21865/g.83235 Transcript_21865/m.83235 type:complete len:203 (-) Transcript_21865:2839-3447(-)
MARSTRPSSRSSSLPFSPPASSAWEYASRCQASLPPCALATRRASVRRPASRCMATASFHAPASTKWRSARAWSPSLTSAFAMCEWVWARRSRWNFATRRIMASYCFARLYMVMASECCPTMRRTRSAWRSFPSPARRLPSRVKSAWTSSSPMELLAMLSAGSHRPASTYICTARSGCPAWTKAFSASRRRPAARYWRASSR